MFKVLLMLSMILSVNAHAFSVESGDNKTLYYTLDGKKLSPIDAFKAAMDDQKILKCEVQEAVANQRTGKVNLKKMK